MVHAYDFDMEVPSTPTHSHHITLEQAEAEDSDSTPPPPELRAAEVDAALLGSLPRRTAKRRRESTSPDGQPHKIRHFSEGPSRDGYEQDDSPLRNRSRSVDPLGTTPGLGERSGIADIERREGITLNYGVVAAASPTPSGALVFDAAGKVQLNSRPVKLRELLRQIIHDSLRSGGRPDSTHSVETEFGELITVRSAGPGESTSMVKIELRVDETVPDTLISKLFVFVLVLVLVSTRVTNLVSSS